MIRQKGFSLVELVIGMVVSGICAVAIAQAWPIVRYGVEMETQAGARSKAEAARSFIESNLAQAVPGSVRLAKAADGSALVEYLVSTGYARARVAADPSSALSSCQFDDATLSSPVDNDGLMTTADSCFKTVGAGPSAAPGDLLLAIPSGAPTSWLYANARPLAAVAQGTTESRYDFPMTSGLAPDSMLVRFAQPKARTLKCSLTTGNVEVFSYAPGASQPLTLSGSPDKTVPAGVTACAFSTSPSGVYGSVTVTADSFSSSLPLAARYQDAR